MSEHKSYIWPNLSGGPVVTDKQGIDYLIVSEDQTELKVYFLRQIQSKLVNKSVFRIEGGERVKTISIGKVEKIAAPGKDYLKITLDRFGDWAPYRLIISESVWEDVNIDPVFSWIQFSFKVKCLNEIDCKAHAPGFEKIPSVKSFDYQAKDYESFKQAMLDRLPSTIPTWWDRAEADFGIALIDLLAYAGDRLSYYQDRAASESHLKTARARQSVSAHLNLLDYALDHGETAAAFVYFEVDRDMTIPEGAIVETPAPDVPHETPLPFTLKNQFPAYKDLDQLKLYDFSHPSLAVPKGALQIAVVGHPEGLEEGSFIIVIKDFKETKKSGNKKIEGQFHLIELSSKPAYKKSSDGADITVLTWNDSYALPWDIPISKSLIIGNIAKLYHGKIHKKSFYVDETPEDFDLPEGPLGYQNSAPMITLKVDGEIWKRVISLKESLPYDMHFQVVDIDDNRSRILFGDNVNGFRPERNSIIEIEYHTGIGASGNVAAGTLTRLPQEVKGIKYVTNPFAGENGRDPETEEHGKLWGPKKIKEQKRAVTLSDYEKEAMTVSGVSRAMARFIWTGSWVTVRITIDPEGAEELSDELKSAVYEHLMSRKMAGYDIQIFPVRYVPLKIKIEFCLKDMAFRDQVLRDLNSALGNGIRVDGAKGFFHPDNWTFGQAVELSSLYAAIAEVQGIECAETLEFKRLRKPESDGIENGEIPMQWDEIARLDNDKSFPERGILDLQLIGGR